MRTNAFEVAIAGGGPAGAAAAIVLARAGVRVLLADSGGGREFRIGEGLPPSARSLLRELGLLERVLADGHRPAHGTIAAWGAEAPRANDFIFQLHGHGLQLDRVRFDALLRAAARDAGAEVVESAQLRPDTTPGGGERAPHRLRLRRRNGDEDRIGASWLIDASGRPAALARALGAARIEHDRMLAYYLRLRSERDSDCDGRTLVEAVEDGWWYSVLLPGGERIAAFLTDPDLIDRRALLDGDGLWEKLSRTTPLRKLCEAHGYRPHGRAHGADASSAELDRAAGDRWLAAGDSAIAFDPLSSKGIGNALYTGQHCARALLAHEHGDTMAPDRYAAHLREIHRVYREQQCAYYAMETRWVDSAFWTRRQPHRRGEAPAMEAARAPGVSLPRPQ
ncbi:NAD(P)/FAD-dependent oxidoreductase [Lysobacter sp. CA196]|uniref:NAD(P)/FAD-dependent oxidoreductase n=1 Tax=Lysobacter sp. CA196 TaxID=3455606 RepID=UPI003F8D0730